jgi:hypothetical protein
MRQVIPDELVDGLSIVPAKTDRPARAIGVIEGPDELRVLKSLLDFPSWSEMMYVASGVRDREGIGADGTGFRYPTDELDPGEEPLEGMDVYSPLGEVQVSVPAFERLMARYFRALITGAERHRDPVIRASWWPDFVKATVQIEDRLRQER